MQHGVWAFPVAWMALILWLGSEGGSAERTGRFLHPLLAWLWPSASPVQLEALHGAIRKLGHVAEYAILAWAWARALRIGGGMARPGAAALAWTIALACGILDEGLQSTRLSRTASVFDVALDGAGALVAAVTTGLGWRRGVDLFAATALWTALVGGAALLAVNHASGVDSGWLWLTVPAAAVAVGWRRVRERPTPSGGDPACREDRRRTG